MIIFKSIKNCATILFLSLYFIGFSQTYPIVDTSVSDYYNNTSIISAPSTGEAFYGQDAQYIGNQPSYTNNGDGTITDNVTGLMWEQDMGTKISYEAAFTKAANSTLGGYTDWRVPTIKELYSLANFTGRCFGDDAVDMFIDVNYFNQPIGDVSTGEREIDAQTWSSTQYVGLIMSGNLGVFGYNFVDGRLKAYPKLNPANGNPNEMYFRMVRGNTSYGINSFVDNGDGTISDNATGLMWQQVDNGNTYDWENALLYCENLSLAGYDDWRLPNAKELHSIVDYTRSLQTTNSPAIDPLFTCSSFTNPNGDSNYGYYWTSSPLQDGPNPYSDAVYTCFGEAQGEMSFPPTFIPTIYDTHGAGAQRNDPKQVGNNTYPTYFGPQGDILYVNNYVRAVRDIPLALSLDETIKINFNIYPNPATDKIVIETTNDLKLKIQNIEGKTIKTIKINAGLNTVSLKEISSGIYFFQLSDSISRRVEKIIIN